MPGFWRKLFGGRDVSSGTQVRPGRLQQGTASSLHGWLHVAPAIWPGRDYLLYVPSRAARWRSLPLIVLFHGCRQTPEAIFEGTGIAALADRLPAYVLIPRQQDRANEWQCWNWFDGRTVAGQGEAAIVAAMIRKASRWRRVDRERSIAAGMSAGAALAAVIGMRYPELVAGVFTHSGIAVGAASSPFTAMTVMRRGPDTDVADIASRARAASTSPRTVALLALVGTADGVVAPRNSAALARQFLAFNQIDVPAGAQSSLPAADRDEHDRTDFHHGVRTREWTRNGVPAVRLVEIDALEHAWSGGDPAFPFHDATGPDATGMLEEWMSAISR